MDVATWLQDALAIHLGCIVFGTAFVQYLLAVLGTARQISMGCNIPVGWVTVDWAGTANPLQPGSEHAFNIPVS